MHDPMTHLSRLDWFVIASYIGFLVVVGALFSRRRLRSVDYFLASRASRWTLVGLASFASNMSPTALVGLAGGAYAMGLAVYDYEWSAVPILVFFCVFMVPVVIASQSYTMPEFLERRYDRRARLLFAIMTLFLIVFVDSAGVLYSAALVCQLLVPALPLSLIVLVIAGAAGAYTITGGLRAVMYTEAVQALVLLAGAALISAPSARRACRGRDCCSGYRSWDSITGAPINRSCSVSSRRAISTTHAGARCSPGCSSCPCCFSWCSPDFARSC